MIDTLPLYAALPGNRLLHKAAIADLVDWILDELRKGDTEGHPFHGNQYVEGESGAGAANPSDVGEAEESKHPGGVKGHLHELLESGKPFTLQELVHATGSNEKRIKFLISRLQNPKYAAAGKHPLIISQLASGHFQVTGTKDKLTDEQKQQIKEEKKAYKAQKEAGKAQDTKLHDNSAINLQQVESGKWNENNYKLHLLVENNHTDPTALKSQVADQLERRLADNEHWDKFVQVAKNNGVSFQHGNMASRLISNWAGTSGDHDIVACAVQHAAQEEFGLKEASVGHLGYKDAQQSYAKAAGNLIHGTSADAELTRNALKAFLRAQYENTQEFFAKNGISEVNVYRGMKIAGKTSNSAPQVTTFHGQPLSSFSTRLATANNFGKSLHLATYNVKDVVGSCLTGFGCKNEYEFVTMGTPTKVVRMGRAFATDRHTAKDSAVKALKGHG